MPIMPLYQLQHVTQTFITGSEVLKVLDAVSLDIFPGQRVAITGASGSGKSSLLHLMGTLAEPVSGTVLFQGKDIVRISTDEKAYIRNADMGFVFQFHHMLPEFTTVENVAMQAIVGGMEKTEAFQLAHDLLQQVGLASRAKYNITLLSGGERQRAAIARAILKTPKVLLADEPTGNLDEKTGRKITELLLQLNDLYKMALVVVTHNPELALQMERRFELKSGDLYDQTC